MSIDLPFSFNRIYEGPPAEGMVFTSTTDLNDYLTSPVRYAGQIVSLVEGGEVTIYKLNAAKDTWEEQTGGGGDSYFAYFEGFEENAPSDVISGTGQVQESSDIPTIPVISGSRSALLNSDLSGKNFILPVIDTTNMSTMGRKVAIEFDVGYISADDDTFFCYVEYSTDDSTYTQLSDTVRITGPNTYSIPIEYDKTTHPYLRLYIESENIVFNSRISLDNYRLNSYVGGNLNDDVVVTNTDVSSPSVNTNYVFEAGNGDLIFTMPEIHTSGDKITVKHLMDGNTEWVEVVPNGSENIDGANTGFFMYDENQSITLISDGTDWYII